MLDLRAAAKKARERVNTRLVEASELKRPPSLSAAAVQRQSDFKTQLLESLRRSGDERGGPSPAPDALFLAFPEKLLSRWAYLAFGPLRRAKGQAADPADIPDFPVWSRWEALATETKLTNFASTNIKGVFIGHGLSPTWDSTFLLADIGRASRASRALGVPVHAMLADVTWMSYNRSVRRFGLSEDSIEDGLRVCLDRRRRLYTAFGIQHTVHPILSYPQKGTIHSEKIKLIAKRYEELTLSLWGRAVFNSDIPLSNEQVATISRPLIHSLGPESPLHTLSRFPGTLNSLEAALKPHLDIIRTLANRFRYLSLETFSYYFAQYYAQTSYRGAFVKVCAVSERDFDEPFDELDESFRSWGEGHEVEISQSTAKKKRRNRMAGIYLPHYHIGTWRTLPYSPLSLDSLVRSNGDIENVMANMLLLADHDERAVDKAARLVRATKDADFIHLNRVCSDIVSLLASYSGAGGSNLIVEACRGAGVESLDDILSVLDENLPRWFAIEAEYGSDWSALWLGWLSIIESDREVDYAPTHLVIACKTADDWSDEAVLAAAKLLVVANGVGYRLST